MSDGNFAIQVSIKTLNGDMINVRGLGQNDFEPALQYVELNLQRLVAVGAAARAIETAGNAGLTSQPQLPPNQQPPFDPQGGGNVQPHPWGSQPRPSGGSEDVPQAQPQGGQTQGANPGTPKRGISQKNQKEWRAYDPPGGGDRVFAKPNSPEWHAIGQALGV